MKNKHILCNAILMSLLLFPTPCLAKTISNIELNIDTDMDEGMTIGNESVTIDVKQGDCEVTDFNIRLNNKNHSKRDKYGYDDDEWTYFDNPTLTIELAPTHDDDKIKLSNKKKVKVSGNSIPTVDKIKSHNDNATITVDLGCLTSGAQKLQGAYIINSDYDYYVDFSECDFEDIDDIYYRIRLNRNNKEVAEFNTSKGEDEINISKYIARYGSGTYTIEAKLCGRSRSSKNEYVEIDDKIDISSDDLKELREEYPDYKEHKENNKTNTITEKKEEKVELKWNKDNIGWKVMKNNSTPLKSEWVQANNNWYYCNENGYIAIGWKLIGDNWFYFNEMGVMTTGWQIIGNYWYYMNTKHDGTFGRMLTGWQFINNNWYYLNTKHDGTFGRMLANTTTPDGYKVAANGCYYK